MLLEAVQKPQKVPRSLSAYQEVRKRAHAGAPSPCTAACMPGEARRHVKGHVYVHLIAVIMSCHMYDWYRIYSIYGLHIKVERPIPVFTFAALAGKAAQHGASRTSMTPLEGLSCTSAGQERVQVHLQDTVEAPEGEQQRVCAAHAKGDVHDSRRCQSTCRSQALSAF